MRHKYSANELKILHKTYNLTAYPNTEEIKKISNELNLSFGKVKVSLRN